MNELLRHYEYLWTTEKDDYFLNDHGWFYTIERKDGSRKFIIKDEEIEINVIVKMIENGCKVVKKY